MTRYLALSLLVSFAYILSFLLRKDPVPKTSSFHKQQINHDHRQNEEVNDEYEITLDIGLGGKEFLIESPFLKSGLEQSIKEYVNNLIQCESDFDPNVASFYSLEIFDNSDTGIKNKKGISGSGKCKGNRTRCKRKLKQSISDAGKNSTSSFNGIMPKNDFCANFRTTSIFDSFSQVLATASYFNYDVNVDVINNVGNLNLNYSVSFVESKGEGLDQIADVDLDADDPIEYISSCSESQCITQNSVMKNIFHHYGLSFDESKHECLYPGVNCNKDNLVTYIWMGE